jgi:hypothetical protein
MTLIPKHACTEPTQNVKKTHINTSCIILTCIHERLISMVYFPSKQHIWSHGNCSVFLFVDIGGIVDHYCLSFLFIKKRHLPEERAVWPQVCLGSLSLIPRSMWGTISIRFRIERWIFKKKCILSVFKCSCCLCI